VEHGWEYVIESSALSIALGSARHPARAKILPGTESNTWEIHIPPGLLLQELKRSFPPLSSQEKYISVSGFDQLAKVLHRAAELAVSLPNQAAENFITRVKEELAGIKSLTTEVERLVKQRVGQDTFRQALLEYWGGSCAVTGIDLPEILRASHAKPWAECGSDMERLNVYNGLLLNANLDALFDRGLVSFSETGQILIGEQLNDDQRNKLGLDSGLKLRWITEEHQPFLRWHRKNLYKLS